MQIFFNDNSDNNSNQKKEKKIHNELFFAFIPKILIFLSQKGFNIIMNTMSIITKMAITKLNF